MAKGKKTGGRKAGTPNKGFRQELDAIKTCLPGAAVEPHAVAILACDDAKSVVLNFVPATGRRRATCRSLWEGTAR
jgi:hypothetical protein